MSKNRMSKKKEKALQKARRMQRAREIEEDEEIVEPEENEQEFSILKAGAKTVFDGFLKVGKGLVSLVAGIGMGASGLPVKDVYSILNSPIPDWPNLFKETWKKFSKDKTKVQIVWQGVKGFLGLGTLTSIGNMLKEISIGTLQAIGGGFIVVKYLKDNLGLSPEVIEAALKTGHPIGLIIGTTGTAVEKANQLCQTLQKQLEKYQSLGEVGTKALRAIESGNYLGAIEHGSAAAEALTGRDLSSVRRAASTANQLYQASSNPEEIIRIVQKTVLPEAQKIVEKFGIKPEQIEAVKGKILFTKDVPAEKRLDAIKGILGKNPGFGIIAQATGYQDALKKLVAHNDPELIEKLTVVNIIGEPGKALSAAALEKLKAAARKQLLTGVKRELRDRSGGIMEHAQRTRREFKERKEHFEGAMSQPPPFYGPLSSNKPKRLGKPQSSYTAPTSKPKPPNHGRKG